MNRPMDATAGLSHEALLAHEGFVLALARKLVRDEATARDLTQETLLAGLQRPPRGEAAVAVRSWLSRVVHRRAANERRGAARRAAREHAAARPEAVEPGASAQERLELVNRVVAAVLALEEPYRNVIVATYYEGLSPRELARQRGIPPGTVRSQLSRALELLRARLDREHGGERRAWSVALAGLLRWRAPAPPPVGQVGSGLGSLVPLSLLAAAGVAVGLVAWRGLEWKAPASAGAVASLDASAVGASEDVALRASAGVRRVVETAPEPRVPAAAPPALSPLDELPVLLERMRQIKTVVLERRLEVPADVRARYAWLEGEPGSGVVNLLDKNLFGHDVDLPWMDGGGAYFSVTEGVHDYQRRPQIAFERRELRSGFYGSYEGAVLDLGPGLFRHITPGGELPFGLDPQTAEAWKLLHAPVVDPTESTRWLPTGMRKLGFDDDADIEPGHTYLVRALSPNEFDVLFALEVADLGQEHCTLAYRLLHSQPVLEPRRPLRTPSETRTELAPPPADLLATPEADLLEELDRVRARGAELLLHTLPPELRERDGDFARLVERQSPWTEFSNVREGGAYYSFATRSHDYDDHPDLELQQGRLESGFSGNDCGVVVDLGVGPLADVVDGWRSGDWGAALDLAVAFEFPHDQPSEAQRQAKTQLDEHLRTLGGLPQALLGHSYVVRSTDVGHHDHLVAFEVVARDAYGVIIDWQLLRTWPVPQTR